MIRSPQDIQPLCLVALQQVPHLADTCAERHVLKELRSACSEARQQANGAVTGLTIHLDEAFPTLDTERLSSVLSACVLRRMCVVLHLASHARIEQDLAVLSTSLQHSMSSVKQMVINMRGVQKDGNLLSADAAVAVLLVGPFCAPLTHFTVTGLTCMGNITDSHSIIIEAVGKVCSSSLTHLSLYMPMLLPRSVPDDTAYDGREDNWLDSVLCYTLNSSAVQALSLFSQLTHLQMKRWGLSEEGEWAALPPSLQCLSIWGTECSLPEDLLLPNMRKVNLNHSKCSTLLQLLVACPRLESLSLISLATPKTEDEQECFLEMATHPTWSLNSDQPTKCISVQEVRHRALSEVYPEEESDEFDAWEVLEELPVLPTITTFKFELFDDYHLEPPGPDLAPEMEIAPVLHHIPRLFPNLRCLHLHVLREIGLDLTPLHACTCLCELQLFKCHYVSGEALLQLANALPKLVNLVTDNYAGQEDALVVLFSNRLLQQHE